MISFIIIFGDNAYTSVNRYCSTSRASYIENTSQKFDKNTY